MAKVKYILIADDDPDDIELFQCAVDEICPEIQLTVADNGEQLISLLEKSTLPDTIFLDLNMPLKNGKECLNIIRAQQAFQNVPVVILSTSCQQTDKDYCLSHGANHYLVKPKSFTGIKTIISNLCSGLLS